MISESPPDLIITDIQMPKLDGIEMIKKVRGLFKMGRMPIVVMSALDSGITKDAIDAVRTEAHVNRWKWTPCSSSSDSY